MTLPGIKGNHGSRGRDFAKFAGRRCFGCGDVLGAGLQRARDGLSFTKNPVRKLEPSRLRRALLSSLTESSFHGCRGLVDCRRECMVWTRTWSGSLTATVPLRRSSCMRCVPMYACARDRPASSQGPKYGQRTRVGRPRFSGGFSGVELVGEGGLEVLGRSGRGGLVSVGRPSG